MKKKIIFLLFGFLLLNGCAQSTALIGPAITIGSSGNVIQAGYSYGRDIAIKQATGKTPGEHVSFYVNQKQEEKKNEKLKNYLETHINMMRKKIYIKSHIEKTRHKISIKENS
tara:strand:+ start:846 stop:1184 length:339 start_codon:yes stop_codon:yes gene_type:complete